MKCWNKKRKPKHTSISKKYIIDFQGVYNLWGYNKKREIKRKYFIIQSNYELVKGEKNEI